MKSLAARVAELEADVLALKSTRTQPPSVQLVCAAEVTLERLKEFYKHHHDEIDNEPDDNRDYVNVCSPIPALERALEAVRGANHKKSRKVARQ